MLFLVLLFMTVAFLFPLSKGAHALSVSPHRIEGFTFRGRNRGRKPIIKDDKDYTVEKVELVIDVVGQMATVNLKQVFKNITKSDIELDFLAPLPNNGVVSGLTLVVNGHELVGDIYEKDRAEKIYENIVRELKDPALIEYAGTGLFRARIFPIPAGQSSSLELRMNYLLTKDDGRVELNFPLSTPNTAKRTILEQDVLVNIKKVPALSAIFSPNPDLEIERDEDGGMVKCNSKDSLGLDNIQLYYQTESIGMGAFMVSHKKEDDDGFFMFLAEPQAQRMDKELPKTVIFLLDTSGSMSGEKIRQAREAALFILSRLSPIDSFNLISFSDTVTPWMPEVQEMTNQNRKSAEKMVNNIRAMGGTFLSGAIEAALKMVKADQPTYILLLTDGQPNIGNCDESGLIELVEKKNPEKSARVFSFGVGYDVNSRLLDRFSSSAGGTTVFVSHGENLEGKVSSFFSKINTPVLSRPVLSSDLDIIQVLPTTLPDIFTGGQLIVVGRYPRGGKASFTLKGKEGTDEKEFRFNFHLEEGETSSGGFISQLWANKRIGEILDQIDLGIGAAATQEGKDELTKELIELSKTYGILTPYTSYLAAEDEDLNHEGHNARTAKSLENLSFAHGKVGALQRSIKRSFSDMTHRARPGLELFDLGETDEPGPVDFCLSQPMPVSGITRKRKPVDPKAPIVLGGRGFFEKKGVLIEGSLSKDEIKGAREVKRFTEEFYALKKSLPLHDYVFLRQLKPIIFKHSAKVYKVLVNF
ncbi:MAG: VIT and VWA domain-containing protein [Deltaproteobacteria bacterium]|jgi:Ca-activated chloride channel family protein|nr:VIT and VWA domain-containing protein [Deltaproteobacteria bacterium]